MRKYAIPSLALAVVLAISAVAYAAQVNTYEVKASTSPSSTKKASSKKPIAVGLKFGYKVGEESGQRPSPVKKYSIAFDGLRVNSSVVPYCNIKKALSDAKKKATKSNPVDKIIAKTCKKSEVGKGFVKNASGASSDPADRSLQCDLNLRLYNEGANKLALYLYGKPPQCVIEVNDVIHAKFVKKGTFSALEFTVPPTLLHPAPGFDNAVENVTSSVYKRSRKVGGKRKGFFEAVGGCKAGKREVSVTFTSESGQKTTEKGSAKC